MSKEYKDRWWKPLVNDPATPIEEDIEKAAAESAMNHGAPETLFHPDYGYILKDGKPTEAGKRWYKDMKAKENDSKDS